MEKKMQARKGAVRQLEKQIEKVTGRKERAWIDRPGMERKQVKGLGATQHA